MRNVMAIGAALLAAGMATAAPVLAPGNLVVLVEGNGPQTPGITYATNAAAPLSLYGYTATGTTGASLAGTIVLPGSISGEYGSSSEGFLHLSGDGRLLTLMGYGVNAADYNANPAKYGTAINNPNKPTALGQSGSLDATRQTAGKTYTPVARVVATIDAAGTVDASTQIYNVFNGNNPRSAYTIDGSSFYVSGQGIDGDTTGGVYYAARGAAAASPVTGRDTTPNKSGIGTANQDTRDVTVHDGQLYVTVDSKGGKDSARSYVGTLGAPGALPTGIANGEQGPAQLPGFGTSKTGKYVVTDAISNGLVPSGTEINLSPEQVFFASDTVMYVTDSGFTKQTSANTIGDGGLQKWVLEGGVWTLKYTLSAGLGLVPNTAAAGTTGLFGLTGVVNGDTVDLYATNYTITGVEQTWLYGITDTLSATAAPAGESFAKLAAAPANTIFKGVAFAPLSSAPEPATWAMTVVGFGMLGTAARRGRGPRPLRG